MLLSDSIQNSLVTKKTRMEKYVSATHNKVTPILQTQFYVKVSLIFRLVCQKREYCNLTRNRRPLGVKPESLINKGTRKTSLVSFQCYQLIYSFTDYLALPAWLCWYSKSNQRYLCYRKILSNCFQLMVYAARLCIEMTYILVIHVSHVR